MIHHYSPLTMYLYIYTASRQQIKGNFGATYAQLHFSLSNSDALSSIQSLPYRFVHMIHSSDSTTGMKSSTAWHSQFQATNFCVGIAGGNQLLARSSFSFLQIEICQRGFGEIVSQSESDCYSELVCRMLESCWCCLYASGMPHQDRCVQKMSMSSTWTAGGVVFYQTKMSTHAICNC